MKTSFLFAAVLACCLCRPAFAQQSGKFGFEIGVGLHAFYMPGIGARFEAPKPVYIIGVFRGLNRSGAVQAGLSLGYTRNKYQGDGLMANLQMRYQPLIGGRLETGIGAGVGYQLAFTPSTPLEWTGDQWSTGARYKGVWQFPLRLNLGYRFQNAEHGQFTPFLAWQTNILLGYSPDLSPLPVSALSAGLRFVPIQK